MNYMAYLNNLARRVRQGDKKAEVKLREAVDPCLRLMVRRFLETGAAPEKWRQPLMEECRCVRDGGKRLPSYLIGEIARNLSTRMVEDLHEQSSRLQSSRETVLL